MIKLPRYNHKFVFKNTLYLIFSLSLAALVHHLFIRLTNYKISHQSHICESMQDSILTLNSNINDNFSVTVLREDGAQVVNINSFKPLIPASNLKLFTTAYALQQLGPKFRLTTTLSLDRRGEFHLFGTGDPDINALHLRLVSNEITNYISNDKYEIKKPYVLNIHEENLSYWWPETWSNLDRDKIYGAPITKLPYSSNSSSTSILNPTKILKSRLKSFIADILGDNQLIVNFDRSGISSVLNEQASTVFGSAPMQSLLSLANSESHNFTAEVLLRNASNTWNNDKATSNLSTWINKQGINANHISIYDGSGLSRLNRLTTHSIASLLWKMSKDKSWYFYRSTLSILGIRGTLTNFDIDNTINGKFYGKTGTLDGVRSISGFIEALDGNAFISIISNNPLLQDEEISEIITLVYYSNSCL